MNAKTNRKRARHLLRDVGATIWLSKQHTWEITRGPDGYTLIDWRNNGTSFGTAYAITPEMYDKEARAFAKHFQTGTPVYVIDAIQEHCADAMQEPTP